jgi:hypothetical protein
MVKIDPTALKGIRKRKADAGGTRKVGEVLKSYQLTDTSHIKKEFNTFLDTEFWVAKINVPLSKASVEEDIKRHGGSCVASYTGNTRFCVSDSAHFCKVSTYINAVKNGTVNPAKAKSGKVDVDVSGIDVVKPSYVLDCVQEQRLLPLEPRYLLHKSEKTKGELSNYFDKFGDSFKNALVDESQLPNILDNVQTEDENRTWDEEDLEGKKVVGDISLVGMSQLMMMFEDEEVYALRDKANMFRDYSMVVHSVEPPSAETCCRACEAGSWWLGTGRMCQSNAGCRHALMDMRHQLRMHGAAVSDDVTAATTHILVSHVDQASLQAVSAAIERAREHANCKSSERAPWAPWVEKYVLSSDWVGRSIAGEGSAPANISGFGVSLPRSAELQIMASSSETGDGPALQASRSPTPKKGGRQATEASLTMPTCNESQDITLTAEARVDHRLENQRSKFQKSGCCTLELPSQPESTMQSSSWCIDTATTPSHSLSLSLAQVPSESHLQSESSRPDKRLNENSSDDDSDDDEAMAALFDKERQAKAPEQRAKRQRGTGY